MKLGPEMSRNFFKKLLIFRNECLAGTVWNCLTNLLILDLQEMGLLCCCTYWKLSWHRQEKRTVPNLVTWTPTIQNITDHYSWRELKNIFEQVLKTWPKLCAYDAYFWVVRKEDLCSGIWGRRVKVMFWTCQHLNFSCQTSLKLLL